MTTTLSDGESTEKQDWVKSAHNLSPPYDYFNFADIVNDCKRHTNRWHKNTLVKALREQTKVEEQRALAIALETLNDKGKRPSAFYDRCEAYWAERERAKVDEHIDKRQRVLMLDQYWEAITALLPSALSNAAESLLFKIAACPPSSRVVRREIRSFEPQDEPFDLILHADMNFTETIAIHFLNMIDSPRNPMQHHQLERNAAFLITIPILHSLFIDVNDVVDMQWIEKQAPRTGNVKWDGIAFHVKSKLITPLFVELSGGVDVNSGESKAISDELKMVQQFVPLLRCQSALGEDSPIQYYIRYHDLVLYFESLTYMNGCFVKRTYFSVPCPATVTELKAFMTHVPEMFQYKAVIYTKLRLYNVLETKEQYSR
ncbi:hypothetical protein MBANPS3_007059 [Mucor bainieri]